MDLEFLSADWIVERLATVFGKTSSREYLSGTLPDPPKPAAVLVPLLRKDDLDDNNYSWHLLLTRRSDMLEEHSGQIAFPGGRSDPNDSSPEATALREAEEEIGLRSNDIQILGRLNNLRTITNYCITPVVGLIPWPFEIHLERGEVSRVFTIPLEWLADPEHHEVRQRTITPLYSQALSVMTIPVIYFSPYEGETLWGVSAEITLNLINVLLKYI